MLWLQLAALLASLPADEGPRLAAYLDRQVADQRVPGGSLLLLHRGEPVFRHAFGVVDREAGRPWRGDEPVRIASLSKPLVAAVTLRLAERGLLHLDQPIDRWLPEFRGVKLSGGAPAPRAPTVRECLNHRGGLRPMDDPGGKPWLVAANREQSMEAMIRRFAEEGLSSAPDRRYAYSGIGYSLVAVAAERATGTPFEELLQSELCRPCGLTRTSFFPDEGTWASIPPMYRRAGAGWERRATRPRPVPGRYFSHAGEIISTADDLARFLLMLRAGGRAGRTVVLRPESVAAMTALPARPRTRYGLGLSLGRPGRDGGPSSVWHTGSSGTMMWWDRDLDVVGVLLSQTADPAEPELLPPPEFIWRARYRADGVFSAAVTDERQRIGVFRGGGSSSDTVGEVTGVLWAPARRILETVTTDRILDGGLVGFDAIIFPGGSGSAQAADLGEAGRQAVRRYVGEGGGYVGVCAGGYLACRGFGWGLGLLDARTVSDLWRRGVGTVQVELTDAGRELLGGPASRVTMPYANGPIWAPLGDPELPDFAPLARFRSELAENGTPVGAMVDTPAVVAAGYGRGRVICFSAHPEKDEARHVWLERALGWAAGGAPTALPRPAGP